MDFFGEKTRLKKTSDGKKNFYLSYFFVYFFLARKKYIILLLTGVFSLCIFKKKSIIKTYGKNLLYHTQKNNIVSCKISPVLSFLFFINI